MSEEMKKELDSRLAETECPAYWGLKKLENPSKSMLGKLQDKNEEIAGQLWRHVVLEIAICYECVQELQYSVALQKLQDCLTWINNSNEDDFLHKYEIPFKHVILSFKAYVALQKQYFSEAKRCLDGLVSLKELKNPELAALIAIKSSVFSEYGIEGTELALGFARRALQLDSSEPEWHFAVGKLLSRRRHFVLHRTPSKEEIECLEQAYRMKQRPHTMVFLAECYIDQSKYLFHSQPLVAGLRSFAPGVEFVLEQINRKALLLFRDALEMNNDQCLHILIRCARGFAILPDKFQNLKLATALAYKALKKSPANVMVLATLSLIHKICRNFSEAIINAKRSADAGCFGSYLKLLNLYYVSKQEYDLEAIIDRILTLFPHDLYRLQVYIYASNFYLFVKRDLFKSLKYFEKCLELDPKFDLLKMRYVRWVRVHLNLYELMYNEIDCAISKESFVNDNERQALSRVRDKIVALQPNVLSMAIERDLINKLKENSSVIYRGRPRTRKEKKQCAPKKRKKNKDGDLKGSQLGPATTKWTPEARNKRQLSHDGRSSSRGIAPKKQFKELEKIKRSLSELSLKEKNDQVLRPDATASSWWEKSKRSSIEAELDESLPDLRLNEKPGWGRIKSSSSDHGQHKRALSHDARSVSRDHGSKRIMKETKKSFSNVSLNENSHTAEKMGDFSLEKILSKLSVSQDEAVPCSDVKTVNENRAFRPIRSQSMDKPLSQEKPVPERYSVEKCDKRFFFPDFKTPKPKPEDLTVENVMKLNKARVLTSRESLDSDDTLESRLSDLSLTKELSVSNVTKRSLSLDATIAKKEEIRPEVERKVTSTVTQPVFLRDCSMQSRSFAHATSLKPNNNSTSRNQRKGAEIDLSYRMRELSLEKRSDPRPKSYYAVANPNENRTPVSRPYNFTSTRPPSNERRPWLPPGTKNRHRDNSNSSVASASSVDSDYICSNFHKPSLRYSRGYKQ